MAKATTANGNGPSNGHGKSPKPALWKIWWTAARPHTLTASLSPVIVGHCVTVNALGPDDVDIPDLRMVTFQWACFCMLIQLGTNLHNDYADFVKGADDDKRVGQARATQKGWLTPHQTASAACTMMGLTFLVGLSFILQIQGPQWRTVMFTIVVLTSVFNGFAYTGGPFPLGYIGLGDVSIAYSGLGDLFVFLYFGLVATLSVPFLYIACKTDGTDDLLTSIIISALPQAVQVACLGTTIIIVNNLRDRHTDVRANKLTMAVRFGATASRMEYALMLVIAFGIQLVRFGRSTDSLVRLMPLLCLVKARTELQAVHSKDGAALNLHVGGAAKVQFLFCLLLGSSLLWES